MKRLTSSAILVLMMTCGVFAQTVPDAAELTKLLNEFLAGASRNDPAAHERFWADDLIYTRSAGQRVNKAEIMHDVRSSPAPKPTEPKPVYTARDIQIQQYGDTAIVAFRLVSTTDTGGGLKQIANNLNSGTFVKRNGKWQVVSWQSTRMPRTEEESKRQVALADTIFHQAVVKAEIKRLTALTDSTFIWTQGTSQMNQKQFFDELSAGGLKYVKPDTAKSSVSVYGDTAVVRGEWPAPKAGRYTLTFANQGGIWKAVAMHTSSN